MRWTCSSFSWPQTTCLGNSAIVCLQCMPRYGRCKCVKKNKKNKKGQIDFPLSFKAVFKLGCNIFKAAKRLSEGHADIYMRKQRNNTMISRYTSSNSSFNNLSTIFRSECWLRAASYFIIPFFGNSFRLFWPFFLYAQQFKRIKVDL